MAYNTYECSDTLIAKLGRARSQPVICKEECDSRTYSVLPSGSEILSPFGRLGVHTTLWYSLPPDTIRGRFKLVTAWTGEEDTLKDLLPIRGEPSEALLSALTLCPGSILKEVFDWCDAYEGPYFPTSAVLMAHLETR